MYSHTGQCLVSLRPKKGRWKLRILFYKYDTGHWPCPCNLTSTGLWSLELMFQLFRPELFEGTLTVDDEVNAGFVVVARGSPESRYLLWKFRLCRWRQLLLRVIYSFLFCLMWYVSILSFGFCGMGEGFCSPSSRGTNNRGGSRPGRTRSGAGCVLGRVANDNISYCKISRLYRFSLFFYQTHYY